MVIQINSPRSFPNRSVILRLKLCLHTLSTLLVVIIGGGAAGAAAAESLASSGVSVSVLSKEAAAGPYDRTLISKRFAEVPLAKELNENISYLSNTEVLSIDPKAKTIRIKRILPDPNKIGCGPKAKE